ncbi:MAG: TatD family hydrolase [Fimbriimonadaceae bacterium]|nr:TatD family hydrolase [Fimbriimonadaceae bacterium]
MIFETHCHIHSLAQFDVSDPQLTGADILSRARESGVGTVVVIGTDPEDWDTALAFAEAHDDVFAALAWHPNSTAEYRPGEIRRLQQALLHPKAIAVGETGLDLHWKSATLEQQSAALQDHLDLAASLSLPVIFHARDATPQLLDVLEPQPRRPYLFHCFSGDAADAARLDRLGGYIGIGGPLTYRKNEVLREIAQTYPRDRIVVETDSPYLSPEPVRGKPNEPANLTHILRRLSDLWDVTQAEAATITAENARRFFGLSGPVAAPDASAND